MKNIFKKFNYLYVMFLTFILKFNYVNAAKDVKIETNNMKCEDLIRTDSDLAKIIDKYVTYIRIIVPILIVVLGTIDFAKAMFSGDEGNMKKAQKRFLIRLGVGALVFFVPTFVSVILNIANSIWAHINADVCLV